MGTKAIAIGTAAIVIVLIVGAVFVLQGQSSAPSSSASPRASSQAATCPVTPGATTTELQKTDTKIGDGAEATTGSTVSARYTGCLSDGTVFDASSLHGNTPFDFTLGAGQVIKGWDDGIVGMKVGGVRTLVIPADQAYGAAGQGSIPGGATLTFQVELTGVK